MPREAPSAFVAEMHRRFPDFVDVRFNEALRRWEFIFTSAAGRPVSQFLGWSFNPVTGKPIEPDPVTGLLPYRELDDAAQRYVIESCEKTYLGNRHDGSASWKQHTRKTIAHNDNLHRSRRRQQAEDYAYAIQQVDIRRPGWKMDHPRGKGFIVDMRRGT
jgi:hypothetical protein